MEHNIDSKDVIKAYEIAKDSQTKAYAPYSHYQVGAALKLTGLDKYYAGCNIENASYGGTVCAERTALFSQIVDRGKSEIEFMVIVTNDTPAAPPCGFCLQVMSEFCRPQTPIFLGNRDKLESKLLLSDLLPHPFNL